MNLAVLTMLMNTTLFAAASPDTFHWSGRMSAGQRIEVRGINGSIHAQPSSGESVEVIASRSNAAGHDQAKLEVRVVEHDGGITVCAVRPMIADVDEECLSDSVSSSNEISVDFTIAVPSGVRFVGRTVNGLVEAKSLDGDAEAHTVNGDVRLSTTGAAQGDTVNGSIIASLGRIDSPLKFSTVNGAITVEVPCHAGARVHAQTVNGKIHTEFRLPVRGQFPANHADGHIGRGGPDLRIATVNGSISLRENKGI